MVTGDPLWLLCFGTYARGKKPHSERSKNHPNIGRFMVFEHCGAPADQDDMQKG